MHLNYLIKIKKIKSIYFHQVLKLMMVYNYLKNMRESLHPSKIFFKQKRDQQKLKNIPKK